MTMLPPRSQVSRLTDAGAFVWATGVEDTVITQPWPGTGRTLDEYALTGHDDQWRQDFARMARLGVCAARYGIPWHRVQPSPGKWNWDWAERRIDRLLELGIEPILDLVHYGLPPWLEGAWLAPDLPARMAEYAVRMAERLRGRMRWYTPVNEPRITAWYCGRLGWWPPNRRGWSGFAAVGLAIARATCATVRALRAVDPELVDVHVDATDVYRSADPALAAEVELRRQVVFLALDLVTGRLDAKHPLHGWLLGLGISADDLAGLRAQAIPDPAVVGINLYPLFSGKVLSRPARGLRVRMPYSPAIIIDDIATAYWQRYQRPVMITETATSGSVQRRQAWMDDSFAAVKRLRARGVPLVGYTWWPQFALVTWAYRQGRKAPGDYLCQMGLWDLDGELKRHDTSLVDAYAAAVAAGDGIVGPLRA